MPLPESPAAEPEPQAPSMSLPPESPATTPLEPPTDPVQQFDLPPLPEPTSDLPGFSNPFRQYEGGSVPGWTYGGDTTLFNDYVQLTPAAPNKVGWIWSQEARKLDQWEVEFDFHVGGAQQRGGGGGLAFWWTSEAAVGGPTYGHTDSFRGLGIFLDTYEPSTTPVEGMVPSGGPEPYIVAIVNDGTPLGNADEPSHGLRVGGGTLAEKQVAVCFASYRNLPAVAKARVAWVDRSLKLWIDLDHTGSESHWQACLNTAPGDPRLDLVPEEGFFGMSASTGVYGDAHVVYSLQPSALSSAADVAPTLHVEAPGEAPVPATHAVKTEAADHQTNVTILTDEKTAEEGSPVLFPQHNPVHVPPTQNADDHLEHFLRALQTQGEIRDQLALVQETVSELSTSVPSKLGHVREELQELQKLQRETTAASTAKDGAVVTAAAAGGGVNHAADFDRATAQVAELSKAVGAMKAVMDSLDGKLFQQDKALATLKQEYKENHDQLLAQSKQLETLISAVSTTTGNIGTALSMVKDEVAGVKTMARASVSDVRSEAAMLSKAIADVKSSSGGSSSTFALAVCAQALVLAAFLFYRSMAGGGKRHSHLP